MSLQKEQPLVTVGETFNENVRFLIPDYQRGYKWTVAEVRKLLEDVNEFSIGKGLEYYCLQNLTLVRNVQNQSLRTVVDGQQRLTTSSIIISYLRHHGIKKLPKLRDDEGAQLSFGDRKAKTTQPFFVDKILDGGVWDDVKGQGIVEDGIWMSREYVDGIAGKLRTHFETWLRLTPKADYDHSDIFHMFCAAMTVASFFRHDGHADPNIFAHKFLSEVRFLPNIVEDTQKTGTSILEAEVFSKINGFRVPLDGADLLRAIFITDAVDQRALGGGLTEREVRLNEARVKLGLEIDEMSAWWQEPRHKKYFAMFDPYGKNKEVNATFDSERYPINILYRLFAASKNVKSVNLDWFEHYEGKVPCLYGEIRRFHSVLKDWYEDRKLYHYAGFLAGLCNGAFAEKDKESKNGIYNLLMTYNRRSDLFAELKKRILLEVTCQVEDEEAKGNESGNPQENELRARLTALTAAITSKDQNWYDEERYSVKKVLTLLDVIAFAEPECLQNDDSIDEDKKKKESIKKRTPLSDHLDPEFFTCMGEDKEHIFPQTPIGGKDRRDFEALKDKMNRYWKLVCKETGKEGNDAALVNEWKGFWRECETLVTLSPNAFPIDTNGLTKKWHDWLFADEERSKETIRRINRFVMLACKVDLNSIGNIVMLDSGINRRYGNDFYTEKRKEIWGQYRRCQPVRLHTYRVFAKEFHDDALGLDVWGQASIEANRMAIKEGIEKFFATLFNKQEIGQ